MFANSEDCTHSPCLLMFLILALLMPHAVRLTMSSLHAACLVMLFNTHDHAPGSAPQVSHERIMTHGRGLTHTSYLC